MSDKPKGLQEGPPIWVESLMTTQEWIQRYKTFKTSTVKEPPPYDPKKYEGGKWRSDKIK